MDTLYCAQLNAHHCKAAMAYLSLLTSNHKIDIRLLQEPYCVNGEPCIIPMNYATYCAHTDTIPRACILIRKDLTRHFILMQQFSSPDTVVIATSSNPPTYFVSTYLPPYNTLAQDLVAIEHFLNTIKLANLIWGLDSNCKHSSWYSPVTDATGRMLMQFLTQNGLLTVNEKDLPTFSDALGDSWIDITASTLNSADRVKRWNVSDEETLSDDNLILFEIMTNRPHTTVKREAINTTRKFTTQVGNWHLFHRDLLKNNKKWSEAINYSSTKATLDRSIKNIWEDLEAINKVSFPPFLPTIKYVPLWSPELNILRKQLNASKRRLKKCRHPLLKDIYHQKYKQNYKFNLM